MSVVSTLLCAVADDDQAGGLVSCASELADAAGFGLLVAHVADVRARVPVRGGAGDDAPAGTSSLPHELTQASQFARAEARERLHSLGVSDEDAVLALGDPVQELLRLGREHEAALLVVGTRARGALRGALLGSVSRALATRGDRPVMVIRPTPAACPGRGAVICATAGTVDDALPVARVAVDLAARLRVPLTLAHILHHDTFDTATDPLLGAGAWEALDLMHRVGDELGELGQGLSVRLVVRYGHPADELVALGQETDAALIVAGSQGRGALRSLLEGGSVSLGLCRRADRPVVIVPPRAAVEPRPAVHHPF